MTGEETGRCDQVLAPAALRAQLRASRRREGLACLTNVFVPLSCFVPLLILFTFAPYESHMVTAAFFLHMVHYVLARIFVFWFMTMMQYSGAFWIEEAPTKNLALGGILLGVAIGAAIGTTYR